MVLVDTPIWSLFLRRRAVDLSLIERGLTRVLYDLIQRSEVQLLGAIRQEVLSGIREESQFQRIRDHLRGFVNVPLDSMDYEEAARVTNQCRQQGIADSTADMLLCAVSLRQGWEILTTDRDFLHYAQVLPLRLFSTP
jgi:predicted nucleic acid-binding protein